MRGYRIMARLHFPRSFAGKLALACLLVAQLPMLLVSWLAFAHEGGQSHPSFPVIIGALIAANLVCFVAMIWIVRAIVAPVRASAAALDDYIRNGTLPALPTRYTDDAGRLMAQVQHTIRALDIASHELRRLASLDPLTSLHNRRWLVERGQNEVARAKREGRPLTAILLDLDHFKRINDDFGHSVGDAALMAIAEIMREQVRSYDILARLGGEEFCLVLPDTDLAEASEIAERVRNAIEACDIPELGSGRCTASLGVVALSPDDAGFLAFISRADNMLYDAKKTGRNRVMVAAAT